jgi:hypothetical protein
VAEAPSRGGAFCFLERGVCRSKVIATLPPTRVSLSKSVQTTENKGRERPEKLQER